jgi:ATP adenylyltransferase
MKLTCKFCQKFGGAISGDQVSDHVLFESPNFIVVPTLGSIIPGWLLVVPRSHFLSVGSFDMPLFQEFMRLQDIAAEALRDCFGPVSFFEHGAVRERESVGCGVDHAHLHIVATEFDMPAVVKRSAETQLQWRPASGIQATRPFVSEQMAYVFVQQSSGGAWIGSASVIESQIMRKVIAVQAGQPDRWDWKTHPFEHNVRETVVKLEAWKAARSEISALA